jgi:MoxR-like ATPase
VTIDDVKEMAPFVLRHRMILTEGASADEVLQRAMDAVPAPVPSRVELT